MQADPTEEKCAVCTFWDYYVRDILCLYWSIFTFQGSVKVEGTLCILSISPASEGIYLTPDGTSILCVGKALERAIYHIMSTRGQPRVSLTIFCLLDRYPMAHYCILSVRKECCIVPHCVHSKATMQDVLLIFASWKDTNEGTSAHFMRR